MEGGDGISNPLRTFKYIKEVLGDEIETEIVASRYYDAYAESYRIHHRQAREEENLKAVPSVGLGTVARTSSSSSLTSTSRGSLSSTMNREATPSS